MGLQAVFAGIHPDWYARADAAAHGEAAHAAHDAFDDELLQRARDSALGRRLLARWLMREADCGELFAPRPDGAIAAVVLRWPRERLDALARDVGVLACAPAIRAEVQREPVRQLRRALGNSYLLALDKQVWNGRLGPQFSEPLFPALAAALADPRGDVALHALFDRHGRAELQAWAARHDPALAQWLVLQHPREPRPATHLPEAQVRFLHDHHLARARAA
ncbi:MAG TPA: hypothetical protein VM619_11150 [Luteimonas sp.]|nr:hypothetical protein [Luteimonas sp.]